MKNIVIFGATSAVAIEVSRQLAGCSVSFVLIGRDADYLNSILLDLEARGASGKVLIADLSESNDHSRLLSESLNYFDESKVDLFLIAYGFLNPVLDESSDKADLERCIVTNGSSAVLLSHEIGKVLKSQGAGSLAVITSVAGDRGRASNYAYGSAKGFVSKFLEGMAQKFANKDDIVITDIKMGIVESPMTEHLTRTSMWVTPDVAARGVIKAVKLRKSVEYVPFRWRYIMQVIKFIPVRIYNKLRL
ncbi:Short-chain dehydrogenase [Vibrio chagasii]|nr:Short-chain dehydrogenase [Vibrio chagasii]